MDSVYSSTNVFTKVEAEAKVGKRILVKNDLGMILTGTTGMVWRINPEFRGEYELIVQWNLPTPPGSRRISWFNKVRYEQFLTEIE